MSQTIEIQLQNYDDHMIMKNFSVATRKMYLRTLKRYLRFHKSKYGQRELSQESAKQFILYRKKSALSWPTINCDYSALRKYYVNRQEVIIWVDTYKIAAAQERKYLATDHF